MNVEIWQHASARSRTICAALQKGITLAGDIPILLDESTWKTHRIWQDDPPTVAIFYSLHGKLRQALRDCTEAGAVAILLDLGYWKRHEGGRYQGYHRYAINGLHGVPISGHPHERAFDFGLNAQASYYKAIPGDHILLCGMSEKASRVYGFKPQQWECWAISELNKYTNREIVYYPKLSWAGASPLPGTTFWRGADHDEIDNHPMLIRAHAVVTHHSNMGLRAIAKGIPVFTVDGICRYLNSGKLSDIEHPRIPGDHRRAQFLADVAYLQWSVPEMASGAFWKHIKEERLVALPEGF